MLARLTTHLQTCFGTHQVAASYMKLSSDWIKQRESHTVHESYVTCWKTSLRWTRKKRNMHSFFYNFVGTKSRTTLSFL